MLFQQVWATTLRACFRNRLVCRRELAVRIIRAAIERVPTAARLLFHQLAIRALRALHANKILLDVLAIRVSAAGDELAIAPVAQHQIAAAFGAEFFQRNVRHTLALIAPPRGLAIRIASAGHELAEA